MTLDRIILLVGTIVCVTVLLVKNQPGYAIMLAAVVWLLWDE